MCIRDRSDDGLGIGEYALGKLYLAQDRIDEAEQLFIKSAAVSYTHLDVYKRQY